MLIYADECIVTVDQWEMLGNVAISFHIFLLESAISSFLSVSEPSTNNYFNAKVDYCLLLGDPQKS